MPQTYIWVHEDALNWDHPVFKPNSQELHEREDKTAVFIWDSAYFEAQAYSLKRLTFIYECLIDMQADDMKIDLYQGDTETVLRGLLGDVNEGGTLCFADTPNPAFLEIAENLKQDFPVAIIKDTPFIETSDDVDMTRFFRFWNRSRKSAFGFKPQT